jgi:hypothetical protein
MNRRTSIKLIEQAAAGKWMRQLAFYHFLKLRFNNSCVYDYKSRMKEVATTAGVCEKTLYGYIKLLRSKDLIYEHHGNLCLKSIRTFTRRKKLTLVIPDSYDLNDISSMLYGKLIEKKASQMAFSESLRRSLRGDKLNDRLRESPFRPSLSFRNIAKLCNLSLQTTKLVIQNLERLGIMKFEKQKPEFISNDFTELDAVKDYPGYRFNIGKRLFEIFGQRIELLQFPVFLKRIDYRRLKKNLSIYVIIVVSFFTKA